MGPFASSADDGKWSADRHQLLPADVAGPLPDVLEAPAESLLSAVEIEVGSRCNRRCSYCPISLDPVPGVPALMSAEVFGAILASLADISFEGRLSYHFYNEPLLRRDLEYLVGQARSAVPGALQVLYTNGDGLNDARYASLRAAGIDWFIVTLHGGRDFPEREFQLVKKPDDLLLSNRGGRLVSLPLPPPQGLLVPCFAPTDMCVITVTGDVVLCCEDSERTVISGNVLASSLATILRNPRLTELRRALMQGRRGSAAAICSRCTNFAHAELGLSGVQEPGLAGVAGAGDTRGIKALSERSRLAAESTRS